MRMKELSEVSGVPVATIKFYQRERLLPAGERTHPNQSVYGDEHLRRIRLIRALIEVGGLSVAAASVDDRDAMVETAVIGMVVGEALTLHLRRMAQEHVSLQRLSRRAADAALPGAPT